MKTVALILLLALIVALTPSIIFAQTLVEFQWDQPDSTTGTFQHDGTICCKSPIPDGDISHYEIFTATPTDTLYYGEVPAPTDISTPTTALVPLQMLVPTSIRVRAVDIRSNVGPFSDYSVTFTVDPGPPGVTPTPAPIGVYFGG